MQRFRTTVVALAGVVLGTSSGLATAFDNLSQGSHIKAYGHDPDWSLEIPGKGNRLVFTIDGETTSYKHAAMSPSIYLDRKTMVYRVPNDDHTLSVFVKGKACQDSSTGKSHEITVIIAYDGKGYGGCGDVLNR